MFLIKLNTSAVEGTLLTQRDSVSLFWDEECLSTFTEALDAKNTMKVISAKIKEICLFVQVGIEHNGYGFSDLTLETSSNIINTVQVKIKTPLIDLNILNPIFQEHFQEAERFMEAINVGLTAFQYRVTHTPEQIENKIILLRKELEFLESF